MTGRFANPFIETFTRRELEILTLLAEGLTNQEIAQSLVIELGTVKWYNTQIYSKLQVENRQQAVTRARALGLLEIDTADPLQRVQHNLPADTLPFIGREREVHEFKQQLTSEKYRLITILGPGGIGKTRLAVEVGRQLLGYFMDGVYFVPLTAVISLEQMVTAIAEVIGFKFHSEQSPRQQLLDHLQPQHLLLIVDNFEHLLDNADLLADILQAAPRVKILTTSRERLGLIGEVVSVIDGLSTPFDQSEEIAAYDAVRLFLEAAHRTTSPGTEADLKVVAHICQMLGGMPLAILLAAAWLDTLSLAEIEEEIRTGLNILEATLRDAPPRHQSIQAVFDYSFGRLSAHEQRVFMRLSVFRGGFTRDAVEAVTGANIRDLQRLVHTSFLQHLPAGRYVIHELMRQYGENKLAASGELTLIQEQHARYFGDLFRPVGEAGWLAADVQLLEAVKPDFENVRAAWHFHSQQKDVISLGQIVDGVWMFLDSYSRSQEALDLFEPLVEVLRDDERDPARLLRGKLVAVLGWFCGDLGMKARALQLSDEALGLLEPYGATEALLLAHAGHVIFLGMANQVTSAIEESKQGLELARQIGDTRWERVFCQLISSACLTTGNYEEALHWAEQMPETAAKYGLKGAALSQLGDYSQAEKYLIQGLRTNQPQRYGRVINYRELMRNALLRGHGEQAWLYLQRGLQYVDDTTYAWAALDLLEAALELFISQQLYSMAVQVLSLIAHHPAAMEVTRVQAAEHYEERLAASLPTDEFAAAWQHGQQLDLGGLITDLMER